MKKTLRSHGLPERLAESREARGLSRRRLSEEAGLSSPTAQMIETSKRMPQIDTIERLADVLKVSPAWLGYGITPTARRVLNYRSAPGYDPLTLGRELADLTNGCGGRVDQSMLYIDPYGAAQYATVAEAYKGLPLRQAAAQITTLHKEPLTVIVLGTGTGRHEVRFVEQLIQQRSRKFEDGESDIDFYLVDISQPLLSTAYKYAAETLARYNVPIVAVEGDFTKLPSYMDYFASPRGPRRKVITMLGYTAGNFANEVTFIRDSLVGCIQGDLLLVDYLIRLAPPSKPAAVKEAEPLFNQRRRKDFHDTYTSFLLNPLTRHYGHNARIHVEPVLDTSSCPIPGSYAVEMRATIDSDDGRKSFIAASYKRYDVASFDAALQSEGWERVEAWEFGDDRPSMLALFRRL